MIIHSVQTHQISSSSASPHRPPKAPAQGCRCPRRLFRADAPLGETCMTDRAHLRFLGRAFGEDWLAEGESDAES